MNTKAAFEHPATIRAMVECMLNLTPRYTYVDVIEPENTAIAVLAKNLTAAIAHYGAKYQCLPEFRIIDWEQNQEEILSVAHSYRVKVAPSYDRRVFLHKKLCVYIPNFLHLLGKGSFLMTLHLLAQRTGIRKGFSIDMSCITPTPNFLQIPPAARYTRQYFDDNAAVIAHIYHAMSDQDSKEIFAGAVRARLDGDSAYIPMSSYREYYHPQVQAQSGDILIDGGVFDGKSTESFSKIVGEQGYVFAFEPEKTCYAQSKNALQKCSNVTLEPYGLWERSEGMHIAYLGMGSRLQQSAGDNTSMCKLIDLDSYLAQKKARCNMIKLDVEGAEPETLKGAEKTLRAHRPRLVISAYHEPYEQLITIPKIILEMDLGYKLYMGHHTPIAWGTILYATPES